MIKLFFYKGNFSQHLYDFSITSQGLPLRKEKPSREREGKERVRVVSPYHVMRTTVIDHWDVRPQGRSSWTSCGDPFLTQIDIANRVRRCLSRGVNVCSYYGSYPIHPLIHYNRGRGHPPPFSEDPKVQTICGRVYPPLNKCQTISKLAFRRKFVLLCSGNGCKC